jgi:hypothetical protein
VDARALIQNNTATTVANIAVAVVQETQQVYPAKTGIELDSSLERTRLTVALSLYVKEADSYKVTVLLDFKT